MNQRSGLDASKRYARDRSSAPNTGSSPFANFKNGGYAKNPAPKISDSPFASFHQGVAAQEEQPRFNPKDFEPIGVPKLSDEEKEKAFQKLDRQWKMETINGNGRKQTTLSAIGVGFLALASLLGFRVRQQTVPVPIRTSNGIPPDLDGISTEEVKPQALLNNISKVSTVSEVPTVPKKEIEPVSGSFPSRPTPLLDSLNDEGPDKLRDMSIDNLNNLAEEVRWQVLDATSVTGGHLGSALGVVDLTVALQ